MKEINQHPHISIKRSVGMSSMSKSLILDEKTDVKQHKNVKIIYLISESFG